MNDIALLCYRESLLEIARSLAPDIRDTSTADTSIFQTHTVAGYRVEVVETMFNWRVCAAPVNELGQELGGYDAVYCYIGKDVLSFVRAVAGATAWYGPDYGDPLGWDKDPGTQRWNPDSAHRPAYADA